MRTYEEVIEKVGSDIPVMGVFQDDGYEGRLIGERPLTEAELAAWRDQMAAIEAATAAAEAAREERKKQALSSKERAFEKQLKEGIRTYAVTETVENYHRNLDGESRFAGYKSQKTYFAVKGEVVMKFTNNRWVVVEGLPTEATECKLIAEELLSEQTWDRAVAERQQAAQKAAEKQRAAQKAAEEEMAAQEAAKEKLAALQAAGFTCHYQFGEWHCWTGHGFHAPMGQDLSLDNPALAQALAKEQEWLEQEKKAREEQAERIRKWEEKKRKEQEKLPKWMGGKVRLERKEGDLNFSIEYSLLGEEYTLSSWRQLGKRYRDFICETIKGDEAAEAAWKSGRRPRPKPKLKPKR